MTDYPKQIDQFTAYAKKVTMNHADALDEQYQNVEKEINDKTEAYLQHQRILDQELSSKIEELVDDDPNKILKTSLIYLKDYYLSTFKNDILQKH